MPMAEGQKIKITFEPSLQLSMLKEDMFRGITMKKVRRGRVVTYRSDEANSSFSLAITCRASGLMWKKR
ncbi:unnamed protein product, partial [Mesorhabditis spiculigera]